ncbi:hypothetical protein EAF00_004693 [Botryotinia globosa]|nr:hypothetical protein EAF00_004693 [Botryotinia globosa]
MPIIEQRENIALWNIPVSDEEREIVYQGYYIIIANPEDPKNPIVRKRCDTAEETFTIPKGYVCELHGHVVMAKLSTKT